MLEVLKSLLSSQSNLIWASLISLVVSAGVSYWFRKRETRHRLQTEYEYEQRKKLRDLIAKYHGRLLNAAISLNYRLFDMYESRQPPFNWGFEEGNYAEAEKADDPYFPSSVYRFMNVCSLIRQFEREALYVDGRIAEKQDFLFLKYLNALRWSITDASFFEFEQTEYSAAHPFYADIFRQDCDSCIDEAGDFVSYDDFKRRVNEKGSPDKVLKFFYSLSDSESGYFRWDRLVVFHLILIGLINAFGYPEQKEPEKRIRIISSQIRRKEVLRNLRNWLPRHGLAKEPLTMTITEIMSEPTLLAKR